MRFLHLSDIHFGKTLFEYSLLEDQEHWCRQVLDYLDRERHDAVVIAGDLYDRSVPPADAVDLCDWFLSQLAGELGLPVLCIAGNHDSPSRLQFGSQLLQAGGLHMAARPQREIHTVTLEDELGPVDFYLIPYLTPSDGKNLFPDQGVRSFQDSYRLLLEHNQPRIQQSQRSVVVAHGHFYPTDVEGVDAVRADSESVIGGLDLVDAKLFSQFDYGAFGHLHIPQWAGLPQLQYCGSPLAYSVSESEDLKGVLSVTMGPKDKVSYETVRFTPLRQVRTVSGTLEELLAPTGGQFSSGDYVLLNIHTDTTLLGAAEQLRNVYPSYLRIQYVSGIQQENSPTFINDDALVQLPLEEAFRRFFLEVTGRELTPEEWDIVQETASENREGVRLS